MKLYKNFMGSIPNSEPSLEITGAFPNMKTYFNFIGTLQGSGFGLVKAGQLPANGLPGMPGIMRPLQSVPSDLRSTAAQLRPNYGPLVDVAHRVHPQQVPDNP